MFSSVYSEHKKQRCLKNLDIFNDLNKFCADPPNTLPQPAPKRVSPQKKRG